MTTLPNGLRRRIPVSVRRALRAARAQLWAIVDRVGARDALVGPAHQSMVGPGDLDEAGREFLHHFQDLGGLTPQSRVLDIGCGVGRMAAPLTTFLSTGSYSGFDVTRHTIESCQRRITSRYPNFRFTWVDVNNDKFNPHGRINPADFRFPYDDNSFDFVFATSVFTHMLDYDVRHYLRELARVLAPDGHALLTWFLIRPTDIDGVGGFTQHDATTWVLDPLEPEAAIAFSEDAVRAWCAESDLTLREPIEFGSWRGESGRSFQDLLVVSA